MSALVDVALQYLWPVVAGIGLVVAYLLHRAGLIRKGERQAEAKVEREGLDRSIEGHKAAERIREEDRSRATDAGDDPNRQYPGGVRGKPPAGKPPPA